jgi:hypothetical protein
VDKPLVNDGSRQSINPLVKPGSSTTFVQPPLETRQSTKHRFTTSTLYNY